MTDNDVRNLISALQTIGYELSAIKGYLSNLAYASMLSDISTDMKRIANKLEKASTVSVWPSNDGQS